MIIRELRDRGATVFLNTHLLEEAEHVCDRVTVIDKGRTVATGTLAELIGRQSSVRLQGGGLTGRWWTDALAGFGTWTAEGEWLLVEEIAAGRGPGTGGARSSRSAAGSRPWSPSTRASKSASSNCWGKT